MSNSERRRIAIVGAGPGGLTLARTLHVAGIDAVVFEREASAHARPQGGSLDMHPETGQYALRCAELETHFKRLARYADQEMRVYDKHGTLHFVDTNCDGDRPEIDRGELRQLLLHSLPEDMICWGRELTGTEAGAEGEWRLSFSDGSSHVADLVVGADGARSRVRPLLSPAQPIYSGVSFVELQFENADAMFPEIARLIGRGMMFALGDSRALIGHRDGNAHLGVYVGLRVPQEWATESGIDGPSNEFSRAALVDYFSDWSQELLQIIHRCASRMTVRPIFALPVGHRWEPRRGVTLLGDAAHLMSPFSGEGANLAMRDGADLARVLAADTDWIGAIEAFEATLFTRAALAAAGARQGIEETFSERGLAHALEHMQAIKADRPEHR